MEIRAIIFALRQAETGVIVSEVCRKMGISEATFYNWKKKYAGLGVPELRKLRQLEEENRQLKQLVAEWYATAAKFGQTNAAGRAKKKALRPVQKKKLADSLITDYRVPVQWACSVICLQRSCCRAAGAVLQISPTG